MGFGLHLNTCNLGTEVRRMKNPFTEEPVDIPIDLGLTEAEREGVQSLLREVNAGEPDPDTYSRITLKDGSIVDIAIGSLNDTKARCGAFAVECKRLTIEVSAFLFRLAHAGNLSIGPTVGTPVIAVVSSEQVARVAHRWPHVDLVETPQSLNDWLHINLELKLIV